MATQFLKKMRAYDCATTTLAPEAPRATGACSLEEPQPKLFPPIMMGYSVFILPGSTNLSANRAVDWSYGATEHSQSARNPRVPATPCGIELLWQAYQSITAKFLILLWLQVPVCALNNQKRVRLRSFSRGYCNGNKRDSLTLEGTKVKYSAGIIWSVSMFCTRETASRIDVLVHYRKNARISPVIFSLS